MMIMFFHNKKFVLFFTVSFLIVLFSCHKPQLKKEYIGFFYTNDCGQSHGGFEWAGQYSVHMVISGNEGYLDIVFSMGLGDPLEKHRYQINDFLEAGGSLSFKIETRPTFLLFIDEDLIWEGKYSGYFTAVKSVNPSEKIGQLPLESFIGLKSHYYAELRLKSSSGMRGIFSLFTR
ncbi:MAG: hypothetical protein ACE5L7_12010 [Candidatus Aminicenantales bacterium]